MIHGGVKYSTNGVTRSMGLLNILRRVSNAPWGYIPQRC